MKLTLTRTVCTGIILAVAVQVEAAEQTKPARAAQGLTWRNDHLQIVWRLGDSAADLRNLGTGEAITIPIGIESLAFDKGRIAGMVARPIRVSVADSATGSVWRFDLPVTRSPDCPLVARQSVAFEMAASAAWIRKKVTIDLMAGQKQVGVQESLLLKEVVVDTLQLAGQAPRQPFDGWQSYPVLGRSFYCGVEFPVARAAVKGEVAELSYKPGLRVEPGTRYVVWPTVYGTAPAGRSRQAFEAYIRTRRPSSGPIHIQYNSWWSAPYPFTEKHMLDLIEAFRENFYKPYGARLDTFCLDLGWTDRQTIWRIDEQNFPLGFANLAWALCRMDSRLGLWCSPSSCYPGAVDNDWAEANGYETFPQSNRRFGCLGGTRYQRAFKESLVNLTRLYGVGHIKYDGYIPTCSQQNHGHEPGELSKEKVALGLIDIFKAVHAANPDSWFEPTCFGFRPSPWWLQYVNTVIGTYGDDAPIGRVPCPVYRESYTTARDFFNLRGAKDVLVPICAQEVLGIIHQSTEPLQNDAVVTVLRGHSFLPLYVNPKFMDERRWRFLAKLCNWARANAELLTHTTALRFGGWADDTKSRSWGGQLPRDAYGYAHFLPDRGLVLLRNPWIKPRRVQLTLDESLGCPDSLKGAPAVSLYPDFARLPGQVSYGDRLDLRLAPYETRLLAVGGYPNAPAPPVSSVGHNLPRPKAEIKVDKDVGMVRLDLDVPSGDKGRQLWVLYESPSSILAPDAGIRVNNVPVKCRTADSDGGWRASGQKVVEHWVWIMADLPADASVVQADLEVMDQTRLSAWLVGTEQVADDKNDARPIPPPEVRYADAVEVLAPVTLKLIGAARPTNLALARNGAKATASSIWASEHEAGMAIDGDMSTRWNSAGGDASGSWLQVDLGAAKKVSQVRFLEACAGRITAYKVQVWTGSDWRDVVTASKEAGKTNVRHRFAPVETAKVRLLMTATTEVPSIYEFEVYGLP